MRIMGLTGRHTSSDSYSAHCCSDTERRLLIPAIIEAINLVSPIYNGTQELKQSQLVDGSRSTHRALPNYGTPPENHRLDQMQTQCEEEEKRSLLCECSAIMKTRNRHLGTSPWRFEIYLWTSRYP
ncbi:uncharacterized protein LOC124168475 [Ischnura elegans]|uniref:uncharacterized protein LOC124168475 n=1 Tax=Ischnura elegans TaxID=197161 RepID=UPI001ED86910|nr:uncharacterized protein LOC124168475 [Ischnura elegans]